MTRIAILFLAVSFLTPFARAEEDAPGAENAEYTESAESSDSSGAAESVGSVESVEYAGPVDFEEAAELAQNEIPPIPVDRPHSGPLFMNFYSVFFGPSLKNPSSLIPTPDGRVDPDLPVHFRNYLALGYNLDDQIALSATAFFLWKPVQGQRLAWREPFLRLSHSGLINSERWNLYGDFRTHFGVSDLARSQDFLVGFQLFQALSYIPDDQGKMIVSLFGSARYNVFGKHGRGNDLELYLAPHFAYRLLPTLSLTLLYEMQAVHFYGAKVGTLENDGTDLEPGVEWNITPTLSINPYINLYPGNQMSLKTSSIGMTLSWNIF